MANGRKPDTEVLPHFPTSKYLLIEKILQRKVTEMSKLHRPIENECEMLRSRILDLENALKLTLEIATKRESVCFKKEQRSNELSEKVRKNTILHYEKKTIFFFIDSLDEGFFFKHVFYPFFLKIVILEQRLLSLQNANHLRCTGCQHLTLKLNTVKEKIMLLLTERRAKLQELNNTK